MTINIEELKKEIKEEFIKYFGLRRKYLSVEERFLLSLTIKKHREAILKKVEKMNFINYYATYKRKIKELFREEIKE